MTRKTIVIWALCAVAAAVALIWPTLPMLPGPDRLAGLQPAGPGIRSTKIKLTQADQKFLGKAKAAQFLIHVRRAGQVAMTVIDGSGNRHAVHDPTYCLAGGGWKVSQKSKVTLDAGEAVSITMEKDGERIEALWFFDDGETQFASPLTYLVKASLRRATLGRSGPEPLLVMIKALPGEQVNWKRIRRILLPAVRKPG